MRNDVRALEDTMHDQLLREVEAVDTSRCALLDELGGLDSETLVAKPLPGKWSILQIVEHLVLAEREVLQKLPDPSQLVERRRGFSTHFTYPMVMFVLRWGIPVKAPSPGMLPTGTTSLPELRRQWDESQRWLRAFVTGLDRHGIGRAVFQHPIAGPLNVQQAVHMGQLHILDHTRQIRRLLSLMN